MAVLFYLNEWSKIYCRKRISIKYNLAEINFENILEGM